ncbi:hypothetical protein ACFL6C_04165 [Myxococcota bacterium]
MSRTKTPKLKKRILVNRDAAEVSGWVMIGLDKRPRSDAPSDYGETEGNPRNDLTP